VCPTVLQSLISRVGLLTLAAVLSACSTIAVPTREDPVIRELPKPLVASAPSAQLPKRPGAYYQDDGPPEQVPPGLLDTPDAEPKIEPYLRGPSKPYTVLDQTFVPITDARPFVQRGAGSWYGRKYHGRKTASGEIYDMFAMTAAHPILPIPSYVRVTNLRNNKQVIVRINDRGPFLASRIIDLSYTAALKLDIIRGGSAELEVERLLPDEIARLQAAKRVTSGAELAKKPSDDPIASVLPQSVPSDSATKSIELAFYLQLGAYGDEMNARTMLDRVLTAWPTHLPQPVIVQSGGWYRVHSGPFSNRGQAAEAARQLQSANQIQATLVQR
jgi:rare lipoprotein A